ncbi:MAG: leucine-rich repeat protein [Clostridiaceae bacterium]|nr:leucine-rich repeat protein [Clostridiaceae bacterium]
MLNQITKIIIPFDIINIANNAFAKCTSLKEVTIGNNVKSIGSNAFANCPLETVYFKGTKAEWDEVCGKNVNLSSADVIFVDYSCGEELSAKFSLNSSTLTIYGSGRMEDCSSAEDLPWYGIKDSIKTVVFDGEPTSIGDYAFSGLSALESIEIPESVTSIGAGAFENCTSLKEITVPSAVDKINENAFKNCTALKTVNLPDGITSIGEKAFYNTAVYNDPASYKGNNVLYLDDNRYLIAYGSQLDGQSFNGIVNPNAVLVADGAFRGADCETVQLSEGLKYIGKEAFADSSVKTVYFPEGVETCSKDIFKGCGSLTVNYGSSISDWYGMDIFLPENSVVYFTAKTEDGKVSVIYCNDDLPQEIGDISIDKNSPELEVKTKAFDGSETQKKFGIISEHTISLDRYDDLEVMDIKLKNYKGEVQPKAGKSVRVKIKVPDSVREKILEFLDFRGDFNGLEINSNGVFLNGNKNKFTAEQQKAVMQKVILWHAFNEGNYQGRIYESFTFNNNLRLENGYLIFYVEHFSEFSVFTSPFEFAEKEVTLNVGTKKKLGYILLDDQKTIHFESSKPSVATVDSSGVVTAQKSGETVITAYCDGVEVGSCTVKVNSPTLIFSENLSGTKVDYMTTVNFFCQVENLPEGAKVRWYIDGSEYALGETCTVKGVKKNFKISVKIVAEDGTVLTEKNEQLIEVKNGFFDKLLGFFRKLFGTLKTVNIS